MSASPDAPRALVESMVIIAAADGRIQSKARVNQDPGFVRSFQTTLTSFFKKKK